MEILTQVPSLEEDSGLWIIYTNGQYTLTGWEPNKDGSVDYSFWKIETDDKGVKHFMYRHSDDYMYRSDDDENGLPTEEDRYIIEQIELALEIRKMIGDIHE